MKSEFSVHFLEVGNEKIARCCGKKRVMKGKKETPACGKAVEDVELLYAPLAGNAV